MLLDRGNNSEPPHHANAKPWHAVCTSPGVTPSPKLARNIWLAGASLAALLAGGLLMPAQAQLAAQDRAVKTSKTCANECHIEIWDRSVMHGPAASDCSACHLQGNPDEHKFFLVADKEKLCLRCHDLPHDDQMHPPVRDGLCLACHDPHGSEHENLLVADPVRLCNQCHQDSFSNAKFVHGPVAVGACVLCHEGHSAPRAALLRKSPQELCLTCHDDVLQIKEGEHLHEALQQDCTACHDPHAADHRYLLQSAAPQLCSTCHEEVIAEMTNHAVVHGALQEENGCSGCHAPHKSTLPKLQKAPQPDICLNCHNKPTEDHTGKTLPNMAKLLADNPNHHGPIREGQCTACHSPHSADHFRLLTDEYPTEFYAPFDPERYKLCFECHIPDLVKTEKGVGLTKFRDRDLNLHYLHVNQEKGRTCRACHEVHASSRPAHIREAVPYGSAGWMLEINFEQSPTGGTCAPACHSPRTYDNTGGGPSQWSSEATAAK
ncbi:MAG: hypothetical protein KDA20_06585 [Phycisphaerales bacterium]|nr:hypothetical protein [Phycisphaerales bacterium]